MGETKHQKQNKTVYSTFFYFLINMMISAYQGDMQTYIHKLTVIKFASSSLLLLPQSKQSCQKNKKIK